MAKERDLEDRLPCAAPPFDLFVFLFARPPTTATLPVAAAPPRRCTPRAVKRTPLHAAYQFSFKPVAYTLRSIRLLETYPPTATRPVPKKIMLIGSGTGSGSKVFCKYEQPTVGLFRLCSIPANFP